MRDNWDISTIQHCGQEKPSINCGLCFEPSGYAAMDNYTAKTMKSRDPLPFEQHTRQYELSMNQLNAPTTPNSQQH
jgi:hypothetical protein